MQLIRILTLLILSNFVLHHSNPLDISSQCEFNDNTILLNCYWSGAWSIEELTIRSYEEFQEYGRKIRDDRAECDSAALPQIDFTKYSLLSKLTQGGCCSDKYERRVLRDSLEKTIVYEIFVEYEGTCEMLCGNFNWVLVPKIPEDYSIKFSIKQGEINSTSQDSSSIEIDSLSAISKELRIQIDSLRNKLHMIEKRIDKISKN